MSKVIELFRREQPVVEKDPWECFVHFTRRKADERRKGKRHLVNFFLKGGVVRAS